MCASPAIISEYLETRLSSCTMTIKISGTYCTLGALLSNPVVALGGKIPTEACSKSPRSKFTAPRPAFGDASSRQHSRREALLAAEIAVMLKAVAWLATPFANTIAAFINENCIVLVKDLSLKA